MTYVAWSFPILAVALLMGSGRVRSIGAGFWGATLAIAVALSCAPIPFGPAEVIHAAARGAWLAWLVGTVILTGLFFWDVISADKAAPEAVAIPEGLRRRRLYTACFLLGPFAESSTGVGVGQVTIVPILKSIGLTPVNVVTLGLLSQTMVPWGALANGTIVGAQLSGLAPNALGVHTALLTVPLLLAWLAMFWRMASVAGVPGTSRDFVAEIAWTLVAAALLVAANARLGPEVAALSALGPLIMLRFFLDGNARRQWEAAIRVGLPYAILIAGIAGTRGFPAVNGLLARTLVVRPFQDGPPWLPLLHPASWLLIIGFVAGLAAGRGDKILRCMQRSWQLGRKSVLTILLFLIMAQVMASSQMAGELARGLRLAFGPAAVLATPVLAGLFGFLTSSSNATNGLLMQSQAALAVESHLSLPWLAAVQNAAAAAMTMLSPVRLAMGCALVGRPDLERAVYARAWPLGAIALGVLVIAAALLLLGG